MYCYKCVDYVKEMLVYELSDDINHIKMHWELAEIIVMKNKKSFFHDFFLTWISHLIFQIKL